MEITKEHIKKVVELTTKIKDIGIKTRKTKYVEARIIYYVLCREFILTLHQNGKYKPISLEKIGKSVNNRTHATVLNGLVDFEHLISNRQFKLKHEFIKCYDYFVEYCEKYKINYYKMDKKYTVLEANNLDHANDIIQELSAKLQFYKKNKFIERILKLSPMELQEMEFKFNVFLKVKEKLRQKEHS